ncbi:hypothetical protein [Halosimplex salinum]|uniref:hypothetical protein n=1 Tax=Halosimplex salinum TaxID=1710538 RepID=UPI000F46B768|nr:hypothetical protein [Halosimplex salinum]
MRHDHSAPGSRPRRPRHWFLRAYVRAVGALLLALSVLFAVFLRVGPKPVWPNPAGAPEAIAARYGFEVVGRPFLFQYVDFLVARLSWWPVLAVLVVGGAVAVVAEFRSAR